MMDSLLSGINNRNTTDLNSLSERLVATEKSHMLRVGLGEVCIYALGSLHCSITDDALSYEKIARVLWVLEDEVCSADL